MSVCMFDFEEDVDDNDDDDDKASKKILQHKGESPRHCKTDCSFKIKISEKNCVQSHRAHLDLSCVVRPRPRSPLMTRSSDTLRQIHGLLPAAICLAVFPHASYDDQLVQPRPPLADVDKKNGTVYTAQDDSICFLELDSGPRRLAM